MRQPLGSFRFLLQRTSSVSFSEGAPKNIQNLSFGSRRAERMQVFEGVRDDNYPTHTSSEQVPPGCSLPASSG